MSDSGDPKRDEDRELRAQREFYEQDQPSPTNLSDELDKILEHFFVMRGAGDFGDNFWRIHDTESVDDVLKAALLAWRDQHTKEAERLARIDEVKRFGTEWGNNPNTPHWYAWDDYIEDRLAELSAPQQSKRRSSYEPQS